MTIRVLILVSILVSILPNSVFAVSACSRVIDRINSDIQQYDNLGSQHRKWMRLRYLQRRLGRAERQVNADQTEYRWECPENDGSFLRVITNRRGKVLFVGGALSADQGNVEFSSELKKGVLATVADTQTESIPTAPTKVKTSTTTTDNSSSIKCNDAINEINSDTLRYGTAVKNQQLVWMDLDWFYDRLGSPITNTFDQTYYRWPTYSIFEDGEGGLASFGTLPNQEGVSPNFQENANKIRHVITLLGEPKKTIVDHLTQYKWQCAGGSFLTLIADDKKTILNINGQLCTNKNCEPVNLTLNVGRADEAFQDQSTPGIQADVKKAVDTSISNFNQRFKMKVRNQSELMAAVSDKMRSYYGDLRRCNPGSYEYAQFIVADLVFPTAVISGFNRGKCEVDISYEAQQNTVEMQCKFNQASLKFFTDKQANKDARRSDANPNNTSVVREAIMSQCKKKKVAEVD